MDYAVYLWRFCAVIFAVFSLLGCGIPSLDSTGRIVCGTSNTTCPPNYSCRFGRCCPTDSSNEMCPVLPTPDNTGLVFRCDASGQCPNNYECRFGQCCPEGSDRTCPAVTLDDQGSIQCNSDDSCPSNGVCLWGRCCAPSSVANRSCPTSLVQDLTAKRYQCINGACPPGYSCANRMCCLGGTNCSNLAIGSPCTSDNDCRDTVGPVNSRPVCITTFPNGYCTRVVRTSAQQLAGVLGTACGRDGQEGINLFPFEVQGLPNMYDVACVSYCRLSTPGTTDLCRTLSPAQNRYVCYPTSSTSNQGVCFPHCRYYNCATSVPGTECNEQSGVCECTSTSCPTGEMCNAETKLCECTDTSCPRGLVCNQDSRSCECTATSCPLGQMCNPSTRRCE